MMHQIVKKKDDWRTHSRNMFIQDEVVKFTRAFRDNFFTLIISSFGLLVALSWNNFWTTWVNSLSPESGIPYKFIIAITMTVLAVIFTYLFSRIKESTRHK